MLKTIKFINLNKDVLVLKRLNYITIFLSHIILINYKNYKYFNKLNLFFVNTFIQFFLKLI